MKIEIKKELNGIIIDRQYWGIVGDIKKVFE